MSSTDGADSGGSTASSASGGNTGNIGGTSDSGESDADGDDTSTGGTGGASSTGGDAPSYDCLLVREFDVPGVFLRGLDGADHGLIPGTEGANGDVTLASDGERLAFVDNDHAARAVNVDGSDPIDVTPVMGANLNGVAWSPDGTELAVRTDSSSPIQIYASDGSGLIHEVDGTTASPGTPSLGYGLAWIGEELFYSCRPGTWSALCSVDANGGPATVIAANDVQNVLVFDASPDGSLLSVHTAAPLQSGGSNRDFVLEPDGGGEVDLPKAGLAFSADGTQLVGEQPVSVMPINGGSPTPLGGFMDLTLVLEWGARCPGDR